ncbi:Major facilitator, sugar transporter-like [Parasponia andersonii]|uniref:Major facilitator, sugar transporter-like n=1 Tax=Parasponia andersonii TaxID=3476 RepID=A0A2P5BKZ9_PARAD|nr:Major facilitator, sugar transporter-like [Parasponia andersonii]
MANLTRPLLSQPNSSDDSTEPPHLEKHLPSLDSTIENCIGDFGWAQFLQAILVSFAWFFDAQQTFISVFADAEPTWHCDARLRKDSCDSVSDVCSLPRDSWGWDLPERASTISEWALQCAGSIITGLPASAFFMGCLLGGLVLATLADSSLGRKKMLSLSCLAMAVSTLLTTFATNVWTYSALRFVGGFSRATIGTCALVLSSELVGKQWRGQVGVIGFFCFTLGFLSLPAIAYLNRGSSWRNLYVWTSVPTIFYSLVVHFLVHESPRWLFVKGRTEEAIATIKIMAQANHKTFTVSFSHLPFEEETWNVDLYSAIKILIEKRWAFRRLSAVMAIGFGIGMVYYGMPLALGNLAFSLYVSVTLNALSELPASLITFFFVGRMNRRSSILVFTILSGICNIVSVLKGVTICTTLQIGLELVSFFSACSAFSILLIFTIELFPTCVRNSAVSMVRQALVLGGVFSPVLAAAGRGDGFLSYGVFGIVIGCSGLFVVCLPETRGITICDTMDEEEHKDKTACGGTASCHDV